MLLTSITPITPRAARCIEVDSADRLFAAGGQDGRSIVSHNSVSQRNILVSCILRPESWRVICIDLKRVELSRYRAFSNVVWGVATTMDQAIIALRYVRENMMKRYSAMEKLGINDFLDLPYAGPALLVMIDEMAELLSLTGNRSEEGKEEDELRSEAATIIGSILRLGRAAGVHVVSATQRPDATFLKGESKNNMAARIMCGKAVSTASSMILDNAEGTRVKSMPRGRVYVQMHGNGDHGQGFHIPDLEWLTNYLAEQGLNPDGTPLSKPRSKLATVRDMSQLHDESLESAISAAEQEITRLQREEAEADDDDDWGFEDEDEDAVETETPAPRVAPTSVKTQEAELEYVDERLTLPEEEPGTVDKWHRPEDDWDPDLDNLIEENNR